MENKLFKNIVFGPIISRRLGRSLGVNLLPCNRKICTFNCVYCECGFNPNGESSNAIFPEASEVAEEMEAKLKKLSASGEAPNVITFAGNGEPTLHPSFAEIIDNTIHLRNLYCPKTRITVLSNATRIGIPDVFNALLRVDYNVQKIDSAFISTINLINEPSSDYDLGKVVEKLKEFKGKVIIQTIFLKGFVNGTFIDNSAHNEVDAWHSLIKEVSPQKVMVYSLDRATPVKTLEKVSPEKLNEIALLIKKLEINVQVVN